MCIEMMTPSSIWWLPLEQRWEMCPGRKVSRALSVSALLYFIPCRKHKQVYCKNKKTTKKVFIEAKFTSHKTYHLNHFKV